AVDPDIAELIDDHRQPTPGCVLQYVPHERRLARAEKSRDDTAGHLFQSLHALSCSCMTNPSGGMRAMTPLRNDAGRSFHGTMPFSERPYDKAASTISSTCSISSSPTR